MDDSFQCWCNPRIEYFKIRHLNSSNRTRRFEIIHWFNHLHFFDPQHSFCRKCWANTYLSLESYLPTRNCCWVREFVKVKIRNLQLLLVCSIILWKSSLTRIEWISGWRSWLASRIQSCVWCLAFTHYMRWCMFWHIRNPRIDPLRIRCWRRRRWIHKKRFPIYHACPKCLAAYRCGLAFPKNGLAFRQDLEKVGKTQVDWERVIVHCVLIQHL